MVICYQSDCYQSDNNISDNCITIAYECLFALGTHHIAGQAEVGSAPDQDITGTYLEVHL
jgi:hypothetical protein